VDPALTGVLTGFLAGDNVTAAYSRAVGENVGPYQIAATLSPAAVLGNYVITYNTAVFTIAKATLTVTADNKKRLFGQPNPAFTVTYSGFKRNETLATSGVTGSPSVTTTATASSPVGTYPITVAQGTLAASNYSFTFVNGTLTVYLGGAVGVNSLTLGSSGTIADAFDSTPGLGGYAATKGARGLVVVSNGAISLSGAVSGDVNSTQGSVALSSGTVITGNVTAGTTINNKGTITGTSTPNAPGAAMVLPAVAACAPYTTLVSGVNITGSYSYSSGNLSAQSKSSITLAPGTYCFNSLSLTGGATLVVSGAVKITVTGSLSLSGGNVSNTTQVPANLQFRSSYTGNNGIGLSGGSNAYFTVYAPGTDITLSGGSPLFGALIGKTLTVSGNSAVHYDISLPAGTFGF
jgi:hypothetical protein